MRHTEKWYQRRLAKYFTEHYIGYEDAVEYLTDPAPNVWQCIIHEEKIKLTLVCDDRGQVHEKREPI